MISHQFLNKNFFFPNWKINTLVLGTFNPSCGEKTDYYYGRKKNMFWKSIAIALQLNENYFLNNLKNKLDIMSKYGFGCTDIIKSISTNTTHRDKICKSYSDDDLFTIKHVKIEYQFEKIKEYILQNKVGCVINTWGKRKSPIEFINRINDFENFCILSNVNYEKYGLSPSPRSKNTKEYLVEYYKKRLLNKIAKT